MVNVLSPYDKKFSILQWISYLSHLEKFVGCTVFDDDLVLEENGKSVGACRRFSLWHEVFISWDQHKSCCGHWGLPHGLCFPLFWLVLSTDFHSSLAWEHSEGGNQLRGKRRESSLLRRRHGLELSLATTLIWTWALSSFIRQDLWHESNRQLHQLIESH